VNNIKKEITYIEITYIEALQYLDEGDQNIIYITNFSDEELFYALDGGKEALEDLELEDYEQCSPKIRFYK